MCVCVCVVCGVWRGLLLVFSSSVVCIYDATMVQTASDHVCVCVCVCVCVSVSVCVCGVWCVKGFIASVLL